MTQEQARAIPCGAKIRDRRTGQILTVTNRVYTFASKPTAPFVVVRLETEAGDVPVRSAEVWKD